MRRLWCTRVKYPLALSTGREPGDAGASPVEAAVEGGDVEIAQVRAAEGAVAGAAGGQRVLLQERAIAGEDEERGARVVVLSDRVWQRRLLGDSAVIDFVPGDYVEVSVTTRDTTVQTQLRAWSDRLDRVLKAES